MAGQPALSMLPLLLLPHPNPTPTPACCSGWSPPARLAWLWVRTPGSACFPPTPFFGASEAWAGVPKARPGRAGRERRRRSVIGARAWSTGQAEAGRSPGHGAQGKVRVGRGAVSTSACLPAPASRRAGRRRPAFLGRPGSAWLAQPCRSLSSCLPRPLFGSSLQRRLQAKQANHPPAGSSLSLSLSPSPSRSPSFSSHLAASYHVATPRLASLARPPRAQTACAAHPGPHPALSPPLALALALTLSSSHTLSKQHIVHRRPRNASRPASPPPPPPPPPFHRDKLVDLPPSLVLSHRMPCSF
ncbi:uncharacterized protein PSFLO_04990 [Pseudozyma flocculosa]|uniref:Uncharacterized protein n=1 Tax=Pseudozyma flocculosa TaxID=84751 RepID=A0A5C3F7X6_9BASI|nr:uncharacterized protein PSFLO_04990 [Pseudozyma flocculosa]